MLVENQSLKTMSIVDTVFSKILALNFAKGRSFNDLSFYPIFPLIWDGKFLSEIQTVVKNIDYSKFLHFWFHKFNQIENSIAYSICKCKNSEDATNNNEATTENITNNNETAKENITTDDNNNTTENATNNNNEIKENATNNNETNKENATNNNEIKDNATDENKIESSHEKVTKVDFNLFLLEMPKCAVPHLFNTSCSFVNNFSNISEREMIHHIYRNKKIIEKKTFRKLTVKWLHTQFNRTFNLKRHSKSLESSLSTFFEEKLSFPKKEQSRDLITLKRTRRVRFCQFFDGNKDAFSCIVEKRLPTNESNKSSSVYDSNENLVLSMKVFSLAGIKSVGEANTGSLSNGIVELSIKNYMKVPIIFNPNHDLLFCVLRHLVVIINRTRCIGNIVFIPTCIYEFAIPTNITGVCGVDNTLILIIDDHIIISYNVEKFPDTNNNDMNSKSFLPTVILDDEGQIQNQLIKNVIACEEEKNNDFYFFNNL